MENQWAIELAKAFYCNLFNLFFTIAISIKKEEISYLKIYKLTNYEITQYNNNSFYNPVIEWDNALYWEELTVMTKLYA